MNQTDECKWCYGTGYDASGLRCTCQPDPFPWWPWIEDRFHSLLKRFTRSSKEQNQ